MQDGKLTRGVLFHQDNAPAHTSTLAMAVIQKFRFKLVVALPYSCDLASSHYYFPNMKKVANLPHDSVDYFLGTKTTASAQK